MCQIQVDTQSKTRAQIPAYDIDRSEVDILCRYSSSSARWHVSLTIFLQIECDNKINQVFNISNFMGTSSESERLMSLDISGHTRDNLLLDPLAVLHLHNRLYITTKGKEILKKNSKDYLEQWKTNRNKFSIFLG